MRKSLRLLVPIVGTVFPMITGAATLASAAGDAGDLVVQRGERNYAGPRCPGKDWTCTTEQHVLQLGLENRFECAPATSEMNDPGLQSCVVVQNNPDGRNEARCAERTSADAAVQVCTINQTGAYNKADVDQVVESRGGPTQSASQTTSVTQDGATRRNEVHVRQHVKQDVHGADPQTQDAHQRAALTQTAQAAGDNWADIGQQQDQQARDASSQRQNTSFGSIGDCDPFNSPIDPNTCANLVQNSDAGDNESFLRQSIDQSAGTDAVASQTQGSPGGGIDGRVHQVSSTGTSRNDADQKNHQKVQAALGSSQSQFEPTSCCGFGSSIGNSRSRENIDQDSTQDASEGTNASQELTIVGASSSPTGSCMIGHHAKNNGDSVKSALDAQPCPFLQLDTLCTNAEGEGHCVSVP